MPAHAEAESELSSCQNTEIARIFMNTCGCFAGFANMQQPRQAGKLCLCVFKKHKNGTVGNTTASAI